MARLDAIITGRAVRVAQFLFLCLLAFGSGSSAAQTDGGGLTPDEIIQRTLKQAKWVEKQDLWNKFGFDRRTVVKQLGKDGKLKELKELWYEADEKTNYPRLKMVKINGLPLTGAALQAQIAEESKTHKALSPKRGHPKRDPGEIALSAEVVDRYHFERTGVELVDGREAYVLSFNPRAASLPTGDLVDHLLNELHGTLWIDREDFEIARAEIRLRTEVKLWAGLLAALRKFTFTVERVRVGERIWFNRRAVGDIEGRELISPAHIWFEAVSTNYHRLAIPGSGPER